MKVEKVSFHWIANSAIFPMLFIIESKSMLNTKAFILVKKHAKHKCTDIKPVYVFLWDRGSTGKCDWVKAIYNAVSKTLLYNSKEAVKFSGATLHSGLGIKPGAKLSLHSGLGIKPGAKLSLQVTSKIFFKK